MVRGFNCTANRYETSIGTSSSFRSTVLLPFLWTSISTTQPSALLARRLVGEVEHPRGEGLRIHEFQGFPIALFLEETLAAA
jgi:hypothetical protein